VGDSRTNSARLLVDIHLTSEGRVRNPLGRSARGGLLHHLVHLLQSKTLGLGDEEVGVDEGAGAERAPEEEDLGAKVALVSVDHVGGDDGDDAVPEPVGGGGQSDTAGTDGQRINLADYDPGAGTPGGSEEEDIDADEGDHGTDGMVIIAVGDTDDGDDELANNHAQSTPQEQRTTTDFLHGVEGDGSGAHVNNGGDHGQKEGVLNGLELLEEGGSEVEDEVDTSPLLHHLERGTEDSAADIGVGVEDIAAEAVNPALKVSGLGNERLLVVEVGVDLVQLGLDEVGVLGLVTDTGKSLAGAVLLALVDVITRGLGEEQKTRSENQGPQHLETDGNAVRARVGAVLGTVVNARGQHETDGDAELVSRDDGTAELAGRNLGHVHDDGGGDKADTESSNKTAGDEQTQAARSSLEDDTDDEDNAATNNSSAATEPISTVTSNQSTKEGPSGENRDNERLPRGGNDEVGRSSSCLVLFDVLVDDWKPKKENNIPDPRRSQ